MKHKLVLALLIITAILTLNFNLNQVIKTSLKLTVLNELGHQEQNVKVQLFITEDDYRNETNRMGEAMMTDKKGRVVFKDLKPVVYYVHAQKGDKTNIGRGVQTDKLEEGKINKTTIIIE